MKKIICISDTHIPRRSKNLPSVVLKEMEKSDILIHTGDFVSFEIYKFLKDNFNLYAVYGNMDEREIFEELPEKRVFKIEGLKIGLYHGIGSPFGMDKKVLSKFKEELPDIIVFGHTHRAFKKKLNNIFLFNPGSCTDNFFAFKRTYGVLEIDKGKIIKAEIIELN